MTAARICMGPSPPWMAAATHGDAAEEGGLLTSLPHSVLRSGVSWMSCSCIVQSSIKHIGAHSSKRPTCVILTSPSTCWMGSLLASVARCQLTNLRAFCAPCKLGLRQAWHRASPLPAHWWHHPADAPAFQSRALLSSVWRCRAATAAQPGLDLSLNSLKRRQAELQQRIEDALKVIAWLASVT